MVSRRGLDLPMCPAGSNFHESEQTLCHYVIRGEEEEINEWDEESWSGEEKRGMKTAW
jgi:hypothetical protein